MDVKAGDRDSPVFTLYSKKMSPRGTVSCRISHPLQLFGPGTRSRSIRNCPRTEELPPEPQEPPEPWHDSDVNERNEEVEHSPYCSCDCGCIGERCLCGCFGGALCCCVNWGEPSVPDSDPDDPIEGPDDPRAVDLSPLSDILFLNSRGRSRQRFRVNVPQGRIEGCSCDCPEHLLNHVSIAWDGRVEVKDEDDMTCREVYETSTVSVTGVSPSEAPGDAPVVFSLNGNPYEAHNFTVLGLDITGRDPEMDLDTFELLNPSFGVLWSRNTSWVSLSRSLQILNTFSTHVLSFEFGLSGSSGLTRRMSRAAFLPSVVIFSMLSSVRATLPLFTSSARTASSSIYFLRDSLAGTVQLI